MADEQTPLSGDVLFATARTRVRLWLPGDVDAIYAVYADPEGARWVDDGQPITRTESHSWLEITARNYAARGYGMFSIESLDTGRVIGFCGLVHPDGQVEPEVKYAFLRETWGQGYASEVIAALVAFAAQRFELNTLIATVAPENLPSQRVLLKTGFFLQENRLDENGLVTQYYVWHAPEASA